MKQTLQDLHQQASGEGIVDDMGYNARSGTLGVNIIPPEQDTTDKGGKKLHSEPMAHRKEDTAEQDGPQGTDAQPAL